jgi:hypothetical protein
MGAHVHIHQGGMMNLRTLLASLPPDGGHAAREGKEYVNGWGIFALPFESGHVLALRVFPQNDFSPYVSVGRPGNFRGTFLPT